MDSKRTTLTHTLRNGELEHVVVVAGEPVQAHSSLKVAICAMALALALTGCESTKKFCDDHPVACPLIVSGLGTSLLMCIPEHSHSRTIGTYPMSDPLTLPSPTIQPVNCQVTSCR